MFLLLGFRCQVSGLRNTVSENWSLVFESLEKVHSLDVRRNGSALREKFFIQQVLCRFLGDLSSSISRWHFTFQRLLQSVQHADALSPNNSYPSLHSSWHLTPETLHSQRAMKVGLALISIQWKYALTYPLPLIRSCNTKRWTLPPAVLGILSENSIQRGYL